MRILSVSELTVYLKEILQADRLLSNVWVKGEISNFKHHSSGHMYFTLKDKGAALRCIMFRSRNVFLPFLPDNGMSIIARGYVDIFQRDGQYQLYVEEMQPDGLGALHLAFEQLKEKLQKEGLFDLQKKKAIPVFPRKIGIVTSLTGAAIRDILSVIKRRFPHVQIIIVPVAVQGDAAPGDIARGIEMLNKLPDIDVMIVGRGGGTLEELWAFNTEIVARSIFSSRIPVISAVGHETDYTIADFVADHRAPTPSAAAEMAVPDKRELLSRLKGLKSRLVLAMTTTIQSKRNKLELYLKNSIFKRPKDRVLQNLQHVDRLIRQLSINMRNYLQAREKEFVYLAGKLDALSPLSTMERGYSICIKPDNKEVVRDAALVRCGDSVEILLARGSLLGIVKEVKEDNNGCKKNEK